MKRKLNSQDVLHVLGKLFVRHGPPAHIRSDNGPEFVALAVRTWLDRLNVRTLFITPGSPWENGYNESFNGKHRDERLNREIFDTLREAQVLIEQWRRFTTPNGRTARSATDHPLQKPSCPQNRLSDTDYPPAAIMRPTWPDSNSGTGPPSEVTDTAITLTKPNSNTQQS